LIPHRPFVRDLTLEQELAEFERLKQRLPELWSGLTAPLEDGVPLTSVVVPSLNLDQAELRKLTGVSFYEERLLFLLIRLRNPRARMVYVTSQPVHPMVLEYYFQFLAGIPASHARARLTLLCAYDASPRSLTEKILERPRLLERIRTGIGDPERAYLTVFNSTPMERRLAVMLGIPLNGLDPQLTDLGTKSGSRKVFREAGVPLPEGFEDLAGEPEVVAALAELKGRKPALRRAVVKLNDSFSGEGNALFRYPEGVAEPDEEQLRGALASLELTVPWETRESYFEKLTRMGGVVEEFLEGEDKRSPSTQLRVGPRGEIIPLSTHDQILGGTTGQVFLGCSFPADDAYRRQIQEAGLRIAEVLRAKGVVSRFAIDFLVWREAPDSNQTWKEEEAWQLAALEINLRMGGTTHPYLALQFLTGGRLDPDSGLFHAMSGHPKYYRATDNLSAESYRGLLPEDLIEILTDNKLHYNHGTETGVLFHLIGALSEFGKLGMTAIANSRGEVEKLYQHALDVLDREAAAGR
jgi:PGM1 C-terminal domain